MHFSSDGCSGMSYVGAPFPVTPVYFDGILDQNRVFEKNASTDLPDTCFSPQLSHYVTFGIYFRKEDFLPDLEMFDATSCETPERSERICWMWFS
ncbi:hypothetical protein TNIN_176401 [Trichonephila inaurata madagascariensis]|uniref:Uncharacterized protein n=1 Tax=Trichonephila inaurata madagascariensis TaxID=2747483 RepID=A0A8X6WZB0_9ARAC|nr:hypothetical protein TNIN_176401 [Trichonephila inaurata madagascariensis]